MQDYEDDFFFEEDKMGMTITSGSVTIMKDDTNLIGISIGGGAPLCPCLYIVQVFDNTPASREGTLQSGDELVGVNGQSVKGKTKVEVAKMIQSAKEEVSINYNKLHADPRQGKTLDIVMKKVKHRLVENLSTSTADALGLSRAILCNDTLVKKLQELQNTEQMYRGLVEHAKRMLKAYFDLLQTYKNIGDAFAAIGVREPQPRASEAFSQFGSYHRQIEKDGIKMLKAIKPILSDMGTYLNKAIPDTKLTIKKYADTKFEYLSYCLKVKEMDDEEYSYSAIQEPLYRVETGNYEYRLILRCRQDARNRFAKLRSDVLVKMELLDNKHVQDVVWYLYRLINGLSTFHNETLELLKSNNNLFPVEMDLTQNAFQYKSTMLYTQDNCDEDDEPIQEIGKEITEHYDVNTKKKRKGDNKKDVEESTSLLPDLDSAETKESSDSVSETANLLAELGLGDTHVSPFTNHLLSPQNNFNSDDMFFNIDLTSQATQNETSKEVNQQEDDIFSEFFSQPINADMNHSDSNLLSGFN
ncbi:protein interacting with PRKCA 1 isoform X2 [Arctopsyche grandis]|uniref:protein interacting with PRKCA 1 isoform X2 n=1 Tax=Arctopsyche grandis TaxID=121162 RepID=UPI00406D70E0